MHFARALRDNKTLTHLDISYNGIGEDALVPLCESLQENEGLTELKFVLPSWVRELCMQTHCWLCAQSCRQ